MSIVIKAKTLIATVLTAAMTLADAASNHAPLGKPSPEQLAWHAMEIEMFVCLDPCTWQGREYDDHSTPLSAINPAQLDTEQWCRVAKSFGAKQILFVAKHTGGFCWWQTDTSDYSIKNTPWKNGKGDVLAELAASCRNQGLRLAIYVYPGDDQWGAPIGSGGKTKDPAKQESYNKVFRQQLTEVLSRYGEICEVWFDGSCVIEVGDLLKQHTPKAVVLQGPQTTLRWPGNEAGVSPYPAWQTVKRADAATGVATALHSDPDGDVWLPMEMDTPLLDHKWFWGLNTDHMLKSLDRLMDIYVQSVGRGGVLLLNSTPDTTGLIPESHVTRYEEFGREIQRRFSKPLAETNGAGRSVELALGKAAWVDHVITMEDIREGQRVRGYAIEAQVDRGWHELLRASSVGYKKIDPFPAVKTSRLRFTATESVGEPLIRRFAAFFADVPVKLEIKSAKASSEHESGNFGAKRMIDGYLSTRWGGSNAAGTNAAWVEFDLGAVRDINRIVIQEGWNRIRRFELQARQQPGDDWTTFRTGTCVGDRCELNCDLVRARELRWIIRQTTDLPTVWEFEVFGPRARDEQAGAPAEWTEVMRWNCQSIGADWTTLDVDLSAHIPQVGQYEVEFQTTSDKSRLEIQFATVLLEGVEAPQACSRRGETNAFIVSRSQVTEGKGSEKTVLRVRARVTGTDGCVGVARIHRVF